MKGDILLKKIISTFLAVSFALSGTCGFAEQQKQPRLIYNCTEVGDTGEMPFIHEGRTMLPFRLLLQTMGAEVGYNDEFRKVNAEKDGTKISFSLDDNYLYVTKGDATLRLKQDVANVVVNDRVYVPIRFIAEAFDLAVGWDNEECCAIIVDLPRYIKDFTDTAYSLNRYISICNSLKKDYSKSSEIDFDYLYSEPYKATDEINFSAKSTVSVNGSLASTDFELTLSSNFIKERLGLDLPSIDNFCGTLIQNEDKIYIKSNLGEILSKYETDDKKVSLLAKNAKKDVWYSGTTVELFKALGIPESLADVEKAELYGKFSADDIAKIISAAVSTDNINSIEDAYNIDCIFRVYKKYFSELFSITDGGDSTYNIKMFFPSFDLIKLAKEINPEIESSPDDLKQLDKITFDTDGSMTVDYNTYGTSSIKGTYNIEEEGYTLKSNLTNKFKIVPNTKKAIEVPQETAPLKELLKILPQ